MWLSLVERLLWEQDAAGSNPVIRTKSPKIAPVVFGLFCFRLQIETNVQNPHTQILDVSFCIDSRNL